MAEKTATELVMPIAILWWVSLVLGFKLWQNDERRTASVFLGMTMLIYVTCAPIVSKFPLQFLESGIQSTNISVENPLDTLLVLGGGTSEAPDGRAQLSSAGDRVGLAMKLYRQGFVKLIVVSGDALEGFENTSQNDPSVQSKKILVWMGVPESAIEELPGSNTSQELLSLKERSDLWRGKRVGLLTSASHMPRALRLAKKNGIDVSPILADFRVTKGRFSFRDLIPSSGGAAQIDIALHEFLGMLIGR